MLTCAHRSISESGAVSSRADARTFGQYLREARRRRAARSVFRANIVTSSDRQRVYPASIPGRIISESHGRKQRAILQRLNDSAIRSADTFKGALPRACRFPTLRDVFATLAQTSVTDASHASLISADARDRSSVWLLLPART